MSYGRPISAALARLKIIVAAIVAISTIQVLVMPSGTAFAAPSGVTAANVQSLLKDSIVAYSDKVSVSDTRFYSGGQWINGSTDCWKCNQGGPGVSAALLAARSGDAAARAQAIETFDYSIRVFKRTNGSFAGGDIDTAFFAVDLGTAAVEMWPTLDAAHRQSWAAAVTGAADFLVANGNLYWYSNGNINMANALVFKLAYMLSGDARYQSNFQIALNFAIAPPPARWPGFGLQYTKVPNLADGSDGSGYLAEGGSNGPGLDWDYLQLQTDITTRLYLLSGDTTALRLMNLFVNQMMKRVDLTNGHYDISGGSRHGLPGDWRYLDTAAVLVLTQHGRSDLQPALAAQWTWISYDFRSALTYTNYTKYRDLGLQVGSMMMALVAPPSAGSTPSTSTAPPISDDPSLVGTSPTPSGYWMVGKTGNVYSFGEAQYMGGSSDFSSTVAIAPTASKQGYWILDASGAIATFGNAKYSGDVKGQFKGDEKAVSLSGNPNGQGYWVFTNKGRVICFGGAPFFGDMSAAKLNGPVLGSVATPSGQGYYMVASDGGVFSFGDASFKGSMGGRPLNAPVQALVPTPDGAGYWLVASDGGVFAFSSEFRGSMGSARLNKPVVGMVAYGNGYLMVASDGGVFNFSTKQFVGSLGSSPPAAPVVSIAAI